MKKRKRPIIVIGNNTPDVQRISVFANVAPGSTSLNATNYYAWDLAFETFSNVVSLTLQSRMPPAASFTTTTITFAFTSIDQVVTALNALNMGTFFKEGTTIKIANDVRVFGNLDLISSVSPESWIYIPVATQFFMYMIDQSILPNTALLMFLLVKTRTPYTYVRGVLKGAVDQNSDQVFNTTGIETQTLISFAGRRLAFEEGYTAVEMQVSTDGATDWVTYDTMPITESLKDRGLYQNTAPVRVGTNLSWQMRLVGARATGYLADKSKYLWSGAGGNSVIVCNPDDTLFSSFSIANANIQGYPAQLNLPSPQPNKTVSATNGALTTAGRKIYQVGFQSYSNNTAGTIITQINYSYLAFSPLPPFVVPMVPITTII